MKPDIGLTSEQAAHRLREHGANEIARQEASSPLLLFLSQFKTPMVGLLLGACVVSGVLGEIVDAIAIGAIVLLNGVVGFLQEYRAERAVLALRAMTAPRARVRRDGRAVVVPAAEVVPGDVLLLEAGDVLAADARVLEAHALATNEAPLTGESTPVEKSPAPVDADAPLAERHDRVFMGTSVARGQGMAEVCATGMQTELGKIAHLMATVERAASPLQARLARVSQTLLYLCLGIVALVAAAGLLRQQPGFEVFMLAVSLAVAAVPEGLPAVVTIALAIGVQRMASRRVLIRKLPAVETLGCATVICTDKTGTLTTGVMVVRELWGSDHTALIDAAACCCDAELAADGRTGIGDPTEVAILAEAARRGIHHAVIESARPRRHVNPFDSERKMMSILRSDGVLYVKGALEKVLDRCAVGAAGASQANAQMAERGLRVLAVATGSGPEEIHLHLVGLIGIADPPRSEAVEAVARARAAGVKTVMITGDHPVTARAIARELGIIGPDDPEDEVVHARATPEDKLRIVRQWKRRGAVVAMTGDGVNDAPALREAHIGVAMGRSGTEVTREAADMILADDNFASIVAAVEEGRGVFDNIRKTLVYLLTGNAAELAVMLAAALAGLPLPLLPLHLLWINLVTDGLPALALVMDPIDPDVLSRPPRRPDEPMLGESEWKQIGLVGVLEAAIVLVTFVALLRLRGLEEARDLAFSTLVFSEILRSFAARSPTRIFWEVGAFTNLRLLAVVAASALIQVAVHYIPLTQSLFRVGSLSASDWALVVAAGLVPVSIVEVSKLVRRRRASRSLP